MSNVCHNQTFADAYPAHVKWITTLARRLAKDDRDLVEDLVQIARIALWELCEHPERISKNVRAATNVGYRRRVISFQMYKFMRRERRAHGEHSVACGNHPGASVRSPDYTAPRLVSPGRFPGVRCHNCVAPYGVPDAACGEVCHGGGDDVSP